MLRTDHSRGGEAVAEDPLLKAIRALGEILGETCWLQEFDR
jgi:hypothetical protein